MFFTKFEKRLREFIFYVFGDILRIFSRMNKFIQLLLLCDVCDMSDTKYDSWDKN